MNRIRIALQTNDGQMCCIQCRQPLHLHPFLPTLVHDDGMISCATATNDPSREWDEAVSVIVSALEALAGDIRAGQQTVRPVSQDAFDRWYKEVTSTCYDA